ncbi:hypothetical protein ERJ75_001706400 [Trypanosoma vivax]|nr:hypothetical protein ERJ75_001706400 [Trypanosoma vivax]
MPVNGQGESGCAGCIARVASETPSRRGGLVLPGASKDTEGTGAYAERGAKLSVRRVGSGFEALGMLAVEKILQPYSIKAHSIKRGALAHAAVAVDECGMKPPLLTSLGRRACLLEHWVAVSNNSAKSTTLV